MGFPALLANGHAHGNFNLRLCVGTVPTRNHTRNDNYLPILPENHMKPNIQYSATAPPGRKRNTKKEHHSAWPGRYCNMLSPPAAKSMLLARPMPATDSVNLVLRASSLSLSPPFPSRRTSPATTATVAIVLSSCSSMPTAAASVRAAQDNQRQRPGGSIWS